MPNDCGRVMLGEDREGELGPRRSHQRQNLFW